MNVQIKKTPTAGWWTSTFTWQMGGSAGLAEEASSKLFR
jgi:hypothetical protein